MCIDKKKKFVFLILHYQNVEVTLACVDSIKEKCIEQDYAIVIVDNNSPNKSGVLLQEKFFEDPLVKILISNKNLGFAKGNNLGFSYIKSNFCPKYIIMMNNDTEVIDKTFLDEIERIDLEYQPAVIGPQIMLLDGEIGKFPFEAVDIKYLRREIKHFLIKRFLFKLGMSKIVKAIEKGKNKKELIEEKWGKVQENVVLNGCCLIFTEKYIDCFDGIYDKTFMYKEEQFLYYRLLRSGLNSIYSPRIKIRHLEGASTDGLSRQKAISFYSREISSDKLLIEYLKNDKLL